MRPKALLWILTSTISQADIWSWKNKQNILSFPNFDYLKGKILNQINGTLF
jgi:hypothetical protein